MSVVFFCANLVLALASFILGRLKGLRNAITVAASLPL